MLCLIALVMCFVTNASALDSIDLTKEIELNIFFEEDTPLVGAEFSLYKVCDVSEDAEYTLTSDFEDCSVDFNAHFDNWEALAVTYAGYVAYNNIQPVDTNTTNSNAVAHFPNEQDRLEAGLYLVSPEVHVQDNETYTSDPFLLALPSEDTENDQWLYSVNVKPKITKGDQPVKVVKIWEDDQYNGNRPADITIHLMRDNELYDSIKLNEGNDWSYNWKSLDSSYYWTITEECSEDYTYIIEKEKGSFVVTNTYIGEIPEPTTVPEEEPDLPQTGVLWWPIPMLIAGGLILIIIGFILRRGSKDEK